MGKELNELMHNILSDDLELKSDPIKKERTIESLYRLWVLTQSRRDFYYDQLNNYIEKIVEKIPPTINKNGKPIYIIYYKGSRYNKDGMLSRIHISYDKTHNCYTRSYHGYVGDSDDISENREEIINLTMDNQRLIMGTEYIKLDKLNDTSLSYIVYRELWKRIDSILTDMNILDDIFTVSICGDKYYVSRTDHRGRTHPYSSYTSYTSYKYRLLHRAPEIVEI